MKNYISIIAMLVCNACYGQMNKIVITQKADTFFLKYQYATQVFTTAPPQYGGYITIKTDTLFLKDSLFIRQIQKRQQRRLEVERDYYFPSNK